MQSEGTKGILFLAKGESWRRSLEVFNLPDQRSFFDEAHSLMLKAREKKMAG